MNKNVNLNKIGLKEMSHERIMWQINSLITQCEGKELRINLHKVNAVLLKRWNAEFETHFINIP